MASVCAKAALRDDDAAGCASVRDEFSTSRGWHRDGRYHHQDGRQDRFGPALTRLSPNPNPNPSLILTLTLTRTES